MFSALGNIFSVKPRQAENTDTRQAIQRHDQDYEQRRKKKESEQNQDFNEDQATVSVEALRLFLENFVKTADSGQSTANKPIEHTNEVKEPATQEPAQRNASAAAMAASSYQTAAEVTQSSVLFETTDQSQGPTLDLGAADIRRIYALIEDLKILHKAHIEFLQIERAETFLDSLINAAEKAKATLPPSARTL